MSTQAQGDVEQIDIGYLMIITTTTYVGLMLSKRSFHDEDILNASGPLMLRYCSNATQPNE